MEDQSTQPNAVRKARQRAGLSLATLAARAGVSTSYLSRLERGKAAVRGPTRLALSVALRTPRRLLFPEDGR